MSDSGVDAGSESNESVCMSLASSASDTERDDEHVPHVRHDLLLPNSFVNNAVNECESEEMANSSYMTHPSLPSTSSQPSLPSLSSLPSLPTLPSPQISHSFERQFLQITSKRDANHCEMISFPINYSYNSEEQHDYCSKMKTSRQRTHELKLKNILRDITGERMLRRAANNNNYEVVERLLNSGVNPRSSDDRNRTALHFAASKGNTLIARLLIEKGANPNQKDIMGNTPLHLAACTNHIEVITLLLTAGTDINSLDNCGRTPLHLAQSKLKLLQHQSNMSVSSNTIKAEVLQVVDMMRVYLQRSGKSAEVELLTAFTSRLHLHQTKEEVDSDVKELLTSISHLTL